MKKMLNLLIIGLFIVNIFVVIPQTNSLTGISTENINEIDEKERKIDSDFQEKKFENIRPGSDEKNSEIPVSSNSQINSIRPSIKSQSNLQVGESIKVDFSSVNKTTKEISSSEYLGTQFTGNMSESKLECPATFGGDNIVSCAAFIDSYDVYIYVLKYFDTDAPFGGATYLYLYEFLTNGSFVKEIDLSAIISTSDTIHSLNVNNLHVTFQKTALHYYYDRSDFAFDKTVATTDGFFEMDENYVYSEFSDAFFDHYLRIRDYYTLALVQDVLVYSTAIGSFAYVQDMAQDEFYVYIATYNIVDSSFNRIYKVLKESPYTVSLLMNLEFRANKITVNEQNEELFTLNSSDNTIRVFDLEGNYIKEFQLNGSIFGFYQNFQDFTFLTSWNEETWFTKNLFILDYQNFDVSTAWENVFIWEFEREISTQLFNQENLNFDDSKESLFWSRTTGLFVEFSARISFVIYDIANPDNLGIDFRLLKLINSSSTEIFTSQYLTLSGISGSYSSSEVIITILYGYTSAFSYVNVSFFDTGSNQEITSGITTIDSILTVQEMKMYIDYLYVERESFSSQIRSKYQYKDNNNFIHFLPIQNYEYRMNFTVNTPTYLEFSNIEPFTPNQLIDYDYVFYDTLPVNYVIEFQSGSNKGLDYNRQDQIVAISETTNEYLFDSSFENNYVNDLYVRSDSTYDIDSIGLNYTIVKNGISSLRIEDSDNEQENILFLNELDYGQYYLEYSYYIETSPNGYDTYNGLFEAGTTKGCYLDTLLTNRWITCQKYFEISTENFVRDGITHNLAFVIDQTSGTYVIFIDDIKINQINTEIETISDSETIFESQFNYWNSKGLFPAINENITLELRDRTENVLIDSYSKQTNLQGTITWIWKGNLVQIEYELRSIAWNNWFNGETNYDKFTESITNWFSGGSGYSISLDSLDSLIGNSLYFAGTPSITGYSEVQKQSIDSDLDFTQIDYWRFWMKGNETIDLRDDIPFFIGESTSSWRGWQEYHSLTGDFSSGEDLGTSWTEFIFEINPKTKDFNTVGFSLENVWRFYPIEFDIIAGDGSAFWIDSIQFIHAQKYYFTPQTVGFTDYAEKELEDSIDFSEGDKELFSTVLDSGGSSTVLNGYLDYYCSSCYPDLQSSTADYDDNYYNYYSFRIMSNNTGDIWIRHLSSGDNNLGSLVANTWTVFTGELPVWISTFTNFWIYQNYLGNSNLKLDYLTLFHIDSLDSGKSIEFEEDNYLEGFTSPANDLEIVSNGYFLSSPIDSSQPYNYIIKDSFSIDTRIFTKLVIEAKFKSTQTRDILFYIESQYDANYYQSFSSSDTWEIFEWDISSKSSMVNNWFRIYFDDSGAHSGNLLDEDLFFVRSIRFVSENPPNLFENSNAFFINNEDKLSYNIWIDNQLLGIYSSWEYIPKNLSVGTHTVRYQAFKNELQAFSLPSAVYEYTYEITESDWMKITIHDQSGKIIDFDSSKTFIESVRLFDNYAYFGDTSLSFNLTITDIFDNILYQNLAESFEQFKEIQITLYSTKIMNIQPNPVFLYITRGSKVFSEWILPNEIVKYYFESDSYNFTIVYSNDVSGGFGSTTTNGTSVSFIYSVNSDSALLVSGYSIQDVFNNMISLQNDINSVNATLNYNRENFTIQFSATNQNVTILINDSSFIIDTINSNFTSIQSNFTAIINALNSNFTSIYSNFTEIIDNIARLLGLFRVHFSIVDSLGIGLPFETALLTLNDTRQLDSDIYLNNNSFVRIKAFDYFNTLLFEENYTINENNQNINVSMTLYEMIAFNNGSYTSYVEIYKNGLLGLNVTIPIGNAISFRLTEGNYDYKVYYFESETQKTDVNDPSLYNYDRKLINVGKIAVSAEFPSKLDFSSPTIKIDALAVSLDKIDYWGIFLEITKATIYFTAGYFVTNFFLRRAIGRHAQDTAYVKPKNKRDWLDQTETKLGFKTDDKDLW